MKTCRGCLKDKKPSQFYDHPGMADGKLNFCKECVRARVVKRRWDDIERVRAFDRARGLTDEHRSMVRRTYRKTVSTKKGREKTNAYKREWAKNNRLKRLAHIAAGNAINRGELIRGPCQRCGTLNGIHAHHEDYTKQLDVIWLCVACHGIRHQEINEAKRKCHQNT